MDFSPASWEPWPHSRVSSAGPSGSALLGGGDSISPHPEAHFETFAWDLERNLAVPDLVRLGGWGGTVAVKWGCSVPCPEPVLCRLHKAPSTLPGLTNSGGSQTPNRFKLGIHLSVAA